MEVGEKYLAVQLFGKKDLTIGCFPVKEKKNPNEPDFKGNGVSVWVRTKQPPKVDTTPVVEDLL